MLSFGNDLLDELMELICVVLHTEKAHEYNHRDTTSACTNEIRMGKATYRFPMLLFRNRVPG